MNPLTNKLLNPQLSNMLSRRMPNALERGTIPPNINIPTREPGLPTRHMGKDALNYVRGNIFGRPPEGRWYDKDRVPGSEQPRIYAEPNPNWELGEIDPPGKIGVKGAEYILSKPKLKPNQISEIAQDLDYGDTKRALDYLKSKGEKYIDGYHVSGLENKDKIIKDGIDTGAGWYGRDEAVYFFADPDDIELAIPYLAMKVNSDTGGDVLVTHFKLPVDSVKDMKWDGFFNPQFDTYSGFYTTKNIKPNQIESVKKFNIPSAEKYKEKMGIP